MADEKDQYDEATLRTKIATLSFEEAAHWTINLLAHVQEVGLKNVSQFPPWYLLEFLKCCGISAAGSHPSTGLEIYNVYTYFDGFIRSRPDYFCQTATGNIDKAMLRYAHQQFHTQSPLEQLKYRISRQRVYFPPFDPTLESDHDINSRLYCVFCFYLFAFIGNGERGFIPSVFDRIANPAIRARARQFLEAMSLTQEDIAAKYRDTAYSNDSIHDFVLFEARPFLHFRDEFYLISVPVFTTACSYGLYDMLKDDNDQRRRFGQVFDADLTAAIRSAFPGVLVEDEIKSRLAHHQQLPKNVDAIVVTSKHLVMFEYKATELPNEIRSNPTPENIRELGKSFVSAIGQAYKFLQFNVENPTELGLPLELPRVLFVVSYKDTYLGVADRVWEDIQPALADLPGGIDESLLDPTAIFFISVDEFEWLMHLGPARLDEIIDRAFQRFGAGQAFDFGRVLASFLKQGVSELPLRQTQFDDTVFRDSLEEMGEDRNVDLSTLRADD